MFEFLKKDNCEAISNKRKANQFLLADGVSCNINSNENTNAIIIGSYDSGKTFGVIKPNIIQMNSSYVVYDKNGEIFENYGKMLLDNGYKVFLFAEGGKSYSYNPLKFCYYCGNIDKDRVHNLSEILCGEEKESACERWLFSACVLYLLEFVPKEKQTLSEVFHFIEMSKTDTSGNRELDSLFDKYRGTNLPIQSIPEYDAFLMSGSEERETATENLLSKLKAFGEERWNVLTSPSAGNEFDRLYATGLEKTAVFIAPKENSDTFRFLTAALVSQIFDSLMEYYDHKVFNTYSVFGMNGLPLISDILDKNETIRQAKLFSDSIVELKKNEYGQMRYFVETDDEDLGKEFITKLGAKSYIKNFAEYDIRKNSKGFPMHTFFMLDNYEDFPMIIGLPKKMAVCRFINASVVIAVHSVQELRNKHGDLFRDVLSNSNHIIFQGSEDEETCQFIHNMTKQYSTDGNDTFSVDMNSIRSLQKGKCYVFTSGEKEKPASILSASDFDEWKYTGEYDDDGFLSGTDIFSV